MSSLILRTTSRLVAPLLVLLSVLVLLRGHDEPGGGFIGGLLVSAAFALEGLANGPRRVRKLLRVDPRSLIGAGVAALVLSGSIALALGQPFLAAQWSGVELPGLGKLGTVLLFDIGVYLAVMGATLLALLAVAED